jgi:Glycosyl hydrolases family 43
MFFLHHEAIPSRLGGWWVCRISFRVSANRTRSYLVIGKITSRKAIALPLIVGQVNTGEHLQAHGAGINFVNGMYYMIGEDKSKASRFANVNCYSSANLVEWSYVGPLLDDNLIKNLPVIERPKVLFNAQTRKYVLYMHADSADYKLARVGVATSDSICGKYTLINSFRPLNRQSRDIGVFQEPNGTAYLLSEDVCFPHITHFSPN